MAAHVQLELTRSGSMAAGIPPGRQWALAALLGVGLLSSWYFATVIAPAGLGAHAPTVEQGLYPEWLGCREILQRRNPYREEVTQQIAATLGTATTAASLENSPRFAYPVFLLALYWPLAILPFASAQLLALNAAILAMAVSIPLWYTRQPPDTFTRVVVTAAIFSGYPVVLAIQLRQPTLIFVALLGATLYCVRSGRLALAGTLGALCAAKPQLAIAVLLPLTMWAGCAWRARKAFLLSLGGTAAALLIASEALVPGWFLAWVRTVRAYSHYAGAKPLLAELLPAGLAIPVAVLLVGSVAVVSFRFRDSDLLFAIGYSAAVFQLLFPFLIYNEVLLLPAALWMAMNATELARRGQWQKLLCGCAWSLLGASAVAMAGLSVMNVISPGAGVKLWTLPFVTAWLYPWLVFAALAWRTMTSGAHPAQVMRIDDRSWARRRRQIMLQLAKKPR